MMRFKHFQEKWKSVFPPEMRHLNETAFSEKTETGFQFRNMLKWNCRLVLSEGRKMT